MGIIFYDCKTAPSPRRARILLAEKGIDYECRQVDLRKGEQLGDEYRKINPGCTVPALVLEDGTILTDNAGISAWAEAYKPEPPLLGSTPAEKGLVASWATRVLLEGFMAGAEALRNSSPSMVNRALPGPTNFEQIPALAARGLQRLQTFLDVLEERLEGRDFLAIDSLSVADTDALVAIDFVKWVKVEPGEQHANLRRWYAQMAARPSAAA